MDERDQAQAMPQEEQGRDESQWTWTNVYDWQCEEHTNQQGCKWWDIKLASNTFIGVDGQKVDVSKHHFSVGCEPAVTHGEPGTPRCTRGVHLPNTWDLTLKRFENTSREGYPPSFIEVNRVEKVTPQQLADGVAERNNQWRAAHRKQDHEQEQAKLGMDMTAKPPRQAEPAL